MLPFSKPLSLQSTAYSGQNLVYKSTSFLPLESTIYSLLFIDYDLQIYRFLLKLYVDSTAQNEQNLQSTFDVAREKDLGRSAWIFTELFFLVSTHINLAFKHMRFFKI